MKRCIILTTLIFALQGYVNFVYASEDKVGYSVETVIPDNQIDKTKTYFDLKMKPNQVQNIYVKLHNNSNKEIKVKALVNNSYTNSNGIIDYSLNNFKVDETLKVPLTNIVKLEKNEYTLTPYKSISVKGTITMPKESFVGEKLGALYFEKVISTKEKKSDSINIENRYAYVVAVKLTETDTYINPNIKLKYTKVDLHNYKPAVIIGLQNIEPIIIDKASINSTIIEKSTGFILKTKNQVGVKFAPNSTMDFIAEWYEDKVKPGEYELKLNISSKDKKWEYKVPLVIKDKDANYINENRVNFNNKGYYKILLLSMLFLLLSISIIVLYRRRRLINTHKNL